MINDRLSAQRIVALAGVVLLIGAGLSIVPATLAQDGGDAPTPTGADGTYVCDDFDSVEELREVYDPNNDVNDLDDDPGAEPEDPDRIACEGKFSDQEPYTTTPTETATATATTTQTATATATATAEETETVTPTETETSTPTATETAAPTETATQTATPTEETAENGGNGKAKSGNGKAKSGSGNQME